MMPTHNPKDYCVINPIHNEGAEAMRADRHSWLERRAALRGAA